MTQMKMVKSDPPETKEILAEAVVRISDSFEALRESGLNNEAVVILLHHKTKVPIGQVRTILDALPRLRGWYCR